MHSQSPVNYILTRTGSSAEHRVHKTGDSTLDYSGSSVTLSRSHGSHVDFSLRKIHLAPRLETATTTEEPL